jgi:hypothetical protein
MILFPKEYRRSAARVFLATLPILYGVKSLPEAFNQALLVAIALWLTNCFFVFCGSFLPRKLFRFSFYLWLATLAQVGYCFMQGDFFWIVSLVLLQPLETFREPLRWRGLQKSLYRGVFFICLMITLSALREILIERFYVWLFAMPAGVFLLLAIMAFVWQNQPGFSEERSPKTKEVVS